VATVTQYLEGVCSDARLKVLYIATDVVSGVIVYMLVELPALRNIVWYPQE
jgi:hypothetical protein